VKKEEAEAESRAKQFLTKFPSYFASFNGENFVAEFKKLFGNEAWSDAVARAQKSKTKMCWPGMLISCK
jgi:hypothetical protein